MFGCSFSALSKNPAPLKICMSMRLVWFAQGGSRAKQRLQNVSLLRKFASHSSLMVCSKRQIHLSHLQVNLLKTYVFSSHVICVVVLLMQLLSVLQSMGLKEVRNILEHIYWEKISGGNLQLGEKPTYSNFSLAFMLYQKKCNGMKLMAESTFLSFAIILTF